MAKTDSVIISGFIAIIIVFVIITSVIYPAMSPTISCESIDFKVNNTENATAHSPIVIFKGLYNDSACALAFSSDRYISSSTGVKVLTNGTGVYPNMTLAVHYVNYDYQKDPYIVGINFGFVVVIAIVLMFVIVYKKSK